MAPVVKSFSITGVDGYIVKVETKTIHGQPMISIVGLGDATIKEARERLEAVLNHGTYHFPQMKIVINLAPSDLQKRGSHFDLAMAIGLLIESNQIRPKNVQKYGFIGELSLNARIRSCAGVLSMIMAAKESGVKDIIVPKDNIKEASLVQGMNIFGFNTLEEVADFLEEKNGYQIPLDESPQKEEHIYPIDFSEVQGQDIMIEYIVIAAVGGHNLLMIGSPGCGKSL